MAELDYTLLSDMNTLVVELTGLESGPSDLDSLLADSAGTHTAESVTVYRPYYVAATILQRALNTRRLRSASGAVFDGASVTIAGLLRQQAARDAAVAETYLDYEVPDGHEASTNVARVTF